MNRMKKIFIIFVLAFIISTISAVSIGYSYYDTKTDVTPFSYSIGTWEWVDALADVSDEIYAYVESQIASDSNLQYIYTPSGNLSSVSVSIDGITYFGTTWNITGYGSTTPIPTLGYVSIVNRSEDSLGNRIHAIVTPAPTDTVPYEGYNFFANNDVDNTLTDNLYSIRLNYGVDMTTSTALTGLTQINFYASRGLQSTDDIANLATNRQFTVEISTDGVNFITLGTETAVVPTSTSYAFTYYSYDIPSEYLGQDLYVKISFNGETLGGGKSNRTYSRLVIDELTFVTGN